MISKNVHSCISRSIIYLKNKIKNLKNIKLKEKKEKKVKKIK